MNKYLFLVQTDGEWTVATKDGYILATTEPNEDAPKIKVHKLTTVPVVTIEEIVREIRDAINAEESTPSPEVSE